MVESYYDKLISTVESIPGTTSNNSGLKALKNGRKRIENTISGCIKEPLAKRMSIDDSECLSILKMDAGDRKRRAMSAFTQKVIREALDNLAKNVRSTLNDNTEDINDYLNNIVEEQEREVGTLRDYFNKFVSDSENQQSDRELNCVMPLLTLNATDLVCDVLK